MKKNIEPILTFTESQMLDYWKCKLHLQPLRRDCSIERDDGINLDEFIKQSMREWYSNLLATAPYSLLPLRDLAGELHFTIHYNLCAEVELPDYVIQPVDWRLSSWRRGLTAFYKPDDSIAAVQANYYSRGRQMFPVAIRLTNKVMIYSASSLDDSLTRAICSVRPTDGTYQLAQSLLSTIPSSLDF